MPGKQSRAGLPAAPAAPALSTPASCAQARFLPGIPSPLDLICPMSPVHPPGLMGYPPVRTLGPPHREGQRLSDQPLIHFLNAPLRSHASGRLCLMQCPLALKQSPPPQKKRRGQEESRADWQVSLLSPDLSSHFLHLGIWHQRSSGRAGWPPAPPCCGQEPAVLRPSTCSRDSLPPHSPPLGTGGSALKCQWHRAPLKSKWLTLPLGQSPSPSPDLHCPPSGPAPPGPSFSRPGRPLPADLCRASCTLAQVSVETSLLSSRRPVPTASPKAR